MMRRSPIGIIIVNRRVMGAKQSVIHETSDKPGKQTVYTLLKMSFRRVSQVVV